MNFRFGIKGLGLGNWELGIRGKGLWLKFGVKDWTLGFEISEKGFGMRVKCLGSRVQGAGFRVQGSGFRV